MRANRKKYKLNQAIILCGGKGTRLGKITVTTPKPLLKINNLPFVEYLIKNLARHNIGKIYLLCCYKAQKFIKKYHNKSVLNSKIICIDEKVPRGTAGGLFRIRKKLNQNFLVINGDTFFNINYLDLFYKFDSKKNLAQIALTTKKGDRYGKFDLQKNKKLSLKKGKFINAGVYIFSKNIFKLFDKKTFSIENEIFPKIINLKKVQGEVYNKTFNSFIDIGIPKDLKKSKVLIPKILKRRTLFLDRDGVINEDFGYVHKKKDFVWKKGIVKLIKYFNDINYYVFVITNQSGIGRGYYQQKDVNILHDWIQNQINLKGAHIDYFYSAPYFKNNKSFSHKDYLMRKPNNGMIKSALRDWNIILKKSLMLGDSYSDEKLANNMNLKFYKVSKKRSINNLLSIIKKNKYL